MLTVGKSRVCMVHMFVISCAEYCWFFSSNYRKYLYLKKNFVLYVVGFFIAIYLAHKIDLYIIT